MKVLFLLTAASALVLLAQEPTTPSGASIDLADHKSSAYAIGPGDHIRIWVLGLEELFDKPFIVDPDGYVQVPLVGRLLVSGSSPAQIRANLASKLRSELREPQVTVSVIEFRSRSVSVLGAVNTPGIHYLEGSKNLSQVLAMAGGLRPDAGHAIKMARKLSWGVIPLPTAHNDETGQFSIAEVELKSLLAADHPEQNIPIRGDDVITVPRAELIYVIGEVAKAGGFPLNERERITALQALSLAGGLTPTASKGNARILRSVAGGADRRSEIPIDLSKLFDGRSADVWLQSNDILFVPNSLSKKVTAKVLETGINLITGVVIWRR